MDTLLKVIEEWGWWYEGNQDTSKTLLIHLSFWIPILYTFFTMRIILLQKKYIYSCVYIEKKSRSTEYTWNT